MMIIATYHHNNHHHFISNKQHYFHQLIFRSAKKNEKNKSLESIKVMIFLSIENLLSSSCRWWCRHTNNPRRKKKIWKNQNQNVSYHPSFTSRNDISMLLSLFVCDTTKHDFGPSLFFFWPKYTTSLFFLWRSVMYVCVWITQTSKNENFLHR